LCRNAIARQAAKKIGPFIRTLANDDDDDDDDFINKQLQVSKEETSKVVAMHNSLTETLILMKQETMTVEESLKTTADALRKQLKDEAHARTVLQVHSTTQYNSFIAIKITDYYIIITK
jgi:organic radical activating enzyme